MRYLAKKQGVKRIIFNRAHDFFSEAERVDLIPLSGNHRGFIIILDQETALYFYQDGNCFKKSLLTNSRELVNGGIIDVYGKMDSGF